jgi:hypothetical protein
MGPLAHHPMHHIVALHYFVLIAYFLCCMYVCFFPIDVGFKESEPEYDYYPSEDRVFASFAD